MRVKPMNRHEGTYGVLIELDLEEVQDYRDSERLWSEVMSATQREIARRDLETARREAQRLSDEAAREASPIKVGMEIKDGRAWSRKGTWWRVTWIRADRDGGVIYDCQNVKKDGSLGALSERLHAWPNEDGSIDYSRLEVRAATGGVA